MPSIRWVHQDLGLRPPVRRLHRRPIHGVASRRVSAVGPVQHAGCQVELQVDRLGQPLEQHLDVAPVGRGIAGGHVDSSPQDLPQPGVTRALLRPVEVPAQGVDGDSDAPPGLVAAVVVALPRLHESLDVRAVEVAAHDPHPFAVAPVQLSAHRIEMQLLRRERDAAGNDRRAIASIEVHAIDRTVVHRRTPHVRPIDVPGLDVDRDTIRERASGHDDLLVGAVDVHGEQAAATAGLEHEQSLLRLCHSRSFLVTLSRVTCADATAGAALRGLA